MRRFALSTVLALTLFTAGSARGESEDDHTATIRNLTHVDPRIRAAAAELLGANDVKIAVGPLIEALVKEQTGPARNAAVESALLDALKKITGKAFTQHNEWKLWWDTEGARLFSYSVLQVRQIQNRVEQAEKTVAGLDAKVDDFRTQLRSSVGIVSAAAVLIIVALVVFGTVSGSRLRAMRDISRQAERYIAESRDLTKRTDRILEDLDAKKTDILGFFSKLKEDNEAEIERFADLLEQNTEHRMREVVMGLREKAEKEIEQTLSEVREAAERELKRTATEAQARIEALFKDRETSFLREVDAHTLFLEASFFAINGKHEDAMRTYKRLLALKPDHYMAWNNLGSVYREKGRLDEAVEAFLKGIEIAPTHAMLLYNLAASYARLKDKPRMLDILARAIGNDGEFKDEALNDPAFKEYWADPAFKDIAEG